MNEIEKPLKSANMHDVVQEWYAKFVEVQQETLFELILAANYMDIKPLLDLTCATVASMIKVRFRLLAVSCCVVCWGLRRRLLTFFLLLRRGDPLIGHVFDRYYFLNLHEAVPSLV